MLHFFFQEGSLPGLGTFGGGQIIETDEAGTQVLSIKPLYPIPHSEGERGSSPLATLTPSEGKPLLPPPPAREEEEKAGAQEAPGIQESGKRWPAREK